MLVNQGGTLMQAQPVPQVLEAEFEAQWQHDLAASFEPAPAMEHQLQLLGLRPGEWGHWLESTRRDLARYVVARAAAGVDVGADVAR